MTTGNSDNIETILRAVCAELDHRIRNGEACCCDEYLHTHPELAADQDATLELVYAEYTVRQELGHAPDFSDYAQRYPDIGSRLQRLLELHDAFDLADTQNPSDSTLTSSPGKPPTDLSDELGSSYEILNEIACGGMGIVYRARQQSLGRIVALKKLRSDLVTAQELERFRREGEAAARLQHPNIVQIFEVGQMNDTPYLVLEYVAGGTLADRLKSGPLSPDQAVPILISLVGAVQYAHSKGIIHRDLKPSNVLLTEDELPKLSDFGLAKNFTTALEASSSGAIIGTVSYMSPEQALGKPVGPSTDIYSLGAVFYEMLTGRPPFEAATFMETLDQLRNEEPAPLRRIQPKLTKDIETICLRCLEKDPLRRYGTTKDLAADLDRFVTGRPIQARRTGAATRMLKWARRRPDQAALATLAMLLAIFGFAGINYQRIRAQQDRDKAIQALNERGKALTREKKIRSKLEESDGKNQRLLYSFQIRVAETAWRENNLTRCVKILDSCPASLRCWEWHYLRGLCENSAKPLPTTVYALSPDGQLMVSKGRNDPTRIMRLDSQSTIAEIPTPAKTERLIDAVFTPGGPGAILSFGRWANLLRRRNKNDDPTPHRIQYWTPDHGILWTKTRPVESTITRVNGDHVVLGCNDGLRVWRLADGSERLHIPLDRAVKKLSTADNNLAAVANYGRPGVQVWNFLTAVVVKNIRCGSVNTLEFSPSGNVLAIAEANGNIRIVKSDGTYIFPTDLQISALSFHPSERWLAVACGDRLIHVLDLDQSKTVRTYRGHTYPPTRVAFTSDKLVSSSSYDSALVFDFSLSHGARHLKLNTASISDDGTILVRDKKKYSIESILHQPTESKNSVHNSITALIHDNGNTLAYIRPALLKKVLATKRHESAYALVLRNVHTGEDSEHVRLPAPPRAARLDLSFAFRRFEFVFRTDWFQMSPTDDHVVGVNKHIYNFKTGAVIELPYTQLHSPSFTPDGKHVATVATIEGEKKFVICNAGTGVHELTSKADAKLFNRFLFSPRDNLLVSSDVNSGIHLWRWSIRKLDYVTKLGSHAYTVSALATDSKGQRLVSGTVRGTMILWDLENRRELLSMDGHSAAISRLRFIRDDQYLVSVAGVETRLWHGKRIEEPTKSTPAVAQTQTAK